MMNVLTTSRGGKSMPDVRSTEVQHFRETQGATRIHLLTINTPFNPSQDRFILIELPHDTFLTSCAQCSPRVTIGYGQLYNVQLDVLRGFLDTVESAAQAWQEDAIPPDVHDGVTITMEVADSAGYRRVRMVDPPEDTPHSRLLAAWTENFPQVRRVVS